ncbi:hypothetical protein AWJ20_2147 [Sugiyamaella lignohabitans]|uniref:Glucuronyl hydrolase n=1 Tax=Sugiyamaella lignohabitans TaxID=796027 RepID=A0A161HFY2_9ASCO|nr:uncharacterized protein AWJ20_2147 [Sugiyamaella lignohabitans]ANB14550.1 hypothetical protein AWJ20_2147 [Sugiyamaella lignohabitans]
MTYPSSLSLYKEILDTAHLKKIIEVAKLKPTIPTGFPHCTPTGNTKEYIYEPFEWWTSGFFPGSLWAVKERLTKTDVVGLDENELNALAEDWKTRLEPHQFNTDTHDIGFLIMPAFWREYQLNRSKKAGEIIVQAAKSLMTRWSDTVQAFRSWTTTTSKRYNFDNPESDFLVIIDNMMNLDLLYAASIITGDSTYADHATKHADTTMKNQFRDDYSSYHLIVFDSKTGTKKIGLTCQGYSDSSCWSRGQAWALYGYASVYKYTKNPKYLEFAEKLADYFLSRVENGAVFWDFDAPKPCILDISAAMIACSGLLLICELRNDLKYKSKVDTILDFTMSHAATSSDSVVILDHSTVNNNATANHRIYDSGLVYADYYFLEVGNRLLDMNLLN